MRPPTACLMCRNRRRRCIAEAPGQPCIFCQKRNVHCTLTLHATSASTVTPESSNVASAEKHLSSALPPGPVCKDLIIIYFRYIHDTTQWIFHKPSVLADFDNGCLPDRILLGIVSIAARFSNHSFFANIDPRRRALPYAKRASTLVDLHKPSVGSIQLCIMLGAIFSHEGEPLTENIYYSIACRMAALIKLDQVNYESVIEREVAIRLLWTLKMCDVWSSAANRVERMLVPVPRRYPMNEMLYQRLRKATIDDVATINDTNNFDLSKTSMLTSIIQLNDILERIITCITTSIEPDTISLPADTIENLAIQLEAWYNDLDPSLRDTEENLRYHAQEGEAHIYLSMFLGLYHYGQLLYYQYLHVEAVTEDSMSTPFAKRCKHYAAALCDLLYRAYDTPGAEVYYAMVGHVLVVASTVQIHIVMFEKDEQQIQAAKYRLQRNYQILTELLCFWPTLDVSMSRLQGFHNACLRMGESTFRMDVWMRRFLIEFAAPIGERPPPTGSYENYTWPLLSSLSSLSPTSGSESWDGTINTTSGEMMA